MLYESEVSAAVVNYLHAKGYHINKESKPTLKDFDKQTYGSKTRVAMAFPDTPEFRKRIMLISN